jgi:hypothetical protein
MALLGSLLVLTGLLVQRRAVHAHGKPEVPQGFTMNPERWWTVWRTAGEMRDARGVRLFVVGLELAALGMTILFYALGYIAGRF